jgi:chemotaxis protein methyltransferase CheR
MASQALFSWSRVSEMVEAATGLHFPPGRWKDLERGFASAAPELGAPDAAQCAERLLAQPPASGVLRLLAAHLTVGETYFFRDPGALEAVRGVLRGRIQERSASGERRLRVWSAGCATGEEPYTLAIMLRELLPGLDDWEVAVRATDINERSLRKAAAGIYGEWSFRGAPAALKARYFTRLPDGRHRIGEEVQRLVRFGYLNLVEESYPSLASDTNAMDLVVCRNVLMYLAPAPMQKVVARLRRALAPGGVLLVSPSELAPGRFPGFVAHTRPGAILLQRDDGEARAQPPWMPSSAPWQALPAPSLPPVSAARAPAPEARAAAPACPGGYEARARECADRGALPEALEWGDRWIASDKLDPRAHFTSALILMELGDTALARAALQRVLYLDPGHLLALVSSGTVELSDGARDVARRHFAAARRILARMGPDEPVPDADGLTAGGLARNLAVMEAAVEAPA